MKPISSPAILTPNVLLLALLAVIIVIIGATGREVPVLSNIHVDILLLVAIGMAICTQNGIGRVAATGQWVHPLAIVNYALGGMILLVTVAVFTGWKLPLIQDDQQALVAMAILAGLKIVSAVTHFRLSRS